MFASFKANFGECWSNFYLVRARFDLIERWRLWTL